jgi:hypothetical protein
MKRRAAEKYKSQRRQVLGKQGKRSFLAPQARAQRSVARLKICAAPYGLASFIQF